MSHVDEGALHAYLDGALDEYPVAEASRIREHLDQCAECAERLEAERVVRSEAHAVLALAAPEMDLPSLEELRAYVNRTRPARSVASTRMVRMGWAASVALALGTGYILRDGQLALQSPSSDVSAAPTMEAVTVSAAAGDAAIDGEAEADDQAAFRSAAEVGTRDLASQVGAETAVEESFAQEVMAEPVPERESTPSPAVVAEAQSAETSRRLGRAVPPEVVANRAAEEVVSTPPAAPVVNDERFNESAGGVVASADVLEEVADPSEMAEAQLPPADLVDSLRQAAGGAPQNTLADAGLAGGAAAQAADAVAVDPVAAEPATDEDRAERRRSDSPVAVTSALESAGSGAFAAKADEGELETLPATAVPGLEMILVSSLGQGTTFLGTHTMQRLEDGGVLDVFNLEPDVELSVLPDRTEGHNEVMLETEEGWIVVRGPRTADELRALLEQLLPDGPSKM